MKPGMTIPEVQQEVLEQWSKESKDRHIMSKDKEETSKVSAREATIPKGGEAPHHKDHLDRLDPIPSLKLNQAPEKVPIQLNKGLKPPKPPISNFMMFLKEQSSILVRKGLSREEASKKAVLMWRRASAAVKDKYQSKYMTEKAKYELKMNKYREKVKSREALNKDVIGNNDI